MKSRKSYITLKKFWKIYPKAILTLKELDDILTSPYSCPYCQAQFIKEADFNNHLRVIMEDVFSKGITCIKAILKSKG